jgi:hypothetical protein
VKCFNYISSHVVMYVSQRYIPIHVLMFQAYLHRVDKLKEFGAAFEFKEPYLERDVQKPRESKYTYIYLLLISYEGGLVATLILFGGLCLATIRQILCNPSQCP